MHGTGFLPPELLVAYLFAHSSRLPSRPRSGAEEVAAAGSTVEALDRGRGGSGPRRGQSLESPAAAALDQSGPSRRVAAGRGLGWVLESPSSVFSTWCNANWCSRNVAEPDLEIAAEDPSP